MTEQTVETQQELPPMFTALDRCDSCGAQAHSRALFSTGTLLFCSHHTKKHRAEIERRGGLIESD